MADDDMPRCPICGTPGVPEMIDVGTGMWPEYIAGSLRCPNENDEQHVAHWIAQADTD